MKFEALLRGVNFRPIEAKSFVLAMNQGHILNLMREPENAYDPNAIQVIDPDTQIFIGFVAKEVAVDIAPFMDEGTKFNCRAAERMAQLSFALDIWSEDEGDFPTNESDLHVQDDTKDSRPAIDDEVPF